MRATTLLKVSVFTATLGLACLLPRTARAQAEVSPDFYELSNTAPPETAQVATTVSNADFHGTFLLPYDVNCSGQNLKSGQYTLSMKSEGAKRMISIRRGAEEMNIRVRRALGNSTASQSAVLVRKWGERNAASGVLAEVECAPVSRWHRRGEFSQDGTSADFANEFVNKLRAEDHNAAR
jgi:hypothetical protein